MNDEEKSLYYESHVTIDPVFNDKLELFHELCKKRSFHVAKLLMQKKKSKNFVISNNDAFCTGRGTESKELETRMLDLLNDLKSNGFGVRRYKIEKATLDSRIDDNLFKL